MKFAFRPKTPKSDGIARPGSMRLRARAFAWNQCGEDQSLATELSLSNVGQTGEISGLRGF